jgi:hypothetical protein
MADDEDDPPRLSEDESDAPERGEKNGPAHCNYEIGRGKTPVHTRFTKGHKRGGRPPGSKNTRTLMLQAWNEKHLVQGRRARLSAKEIAARRLAKKAAEGDLKVFEKFERTEAEEFVRRAARQADSRFNEPADAVTMAGIIQRIRNMPVEEPVPETVVEDGANGGSPPESLECHNDDSPAEERESHP